MSDYIASVREAHLALGHTVGAAPAIRDAGLRRSLITEEADEVIRALEMGDLAGLGGELSDLIYVLAGTAVSFGLPDVALPTPRAPHGPPRLRLMGMAIDAIMNTVVAVNLAIVEERIGDMSDVLARAIAAAQAVAALEGLELDPFFAAVHAANLAKASGVRRADGKWGKPPGWIPADLPGILAAQQRQRS